MQTRHGNNGHATEQTQKPAPEKRHLCTKPPDADPHVRWCGSPEGNAPDDPIRPSFQGKLEVACHNSGNRDVLIQILPTQGISVHFNSNLGQLIFARRRQETEPVGRKADDASERFGSGTPARGPTRAKTKITQNGAGDGLSGLASPEFIFVNWRESLNKFRCRCSSGAPTRKGRN